MPVVFYTEKCVGCRACEIACSYYHRKIFSRKIATSIEVKRRPKEGKFGIVLHRQTENKYLACDCTEGSEFCLKYCPDTARNELKAILKGEIPSGKEESKW